MDDYFEQVELDLRHAQRENPDVVLPWSWWRGQGERHGMSANAVYTRAIKVGLYVHPSKRGKGSDAESRNGEAVIPPPPATSRASLNRKRPSDPSRNARKDVEATPLEQAVSKPSPATTAGAVPSPNSNFLPPLSLGDAIQGVSSLVEHASDLERRNAELARTLEEARVENRSLRRALREMDDLAEQVRQRYLQSLNSDL